MATLWESRSVYEVIAFMQDYCAERMCSDCKYNDYDQCPSDRNPEDWNVKRLSHITETTINNKRIQDEQREKNDPKVSV